jgi:fatty-acyl-CoA synthase
MATLELTGAAFDAEAFGRFLTEQEDLGTKWAPRFVRIVEHMPLTGTNKVDKRPLRSAGWRTTDPVWWRPFVGRGVDATTPSYRLLLASDIDALQEEFAAHGRSGLLDY